MQGDRQWIAQPQGASKQQARVHKQEAAGSFGASCPGQHDKAGTGQRECAECGTAPLASCNPRVIAAEYQHHDGEIGWIEYMFAFDSQEIFAAYCDRCSKNRKRCLVRSEKHC